MDYFDKDLYKGMDNNTVSFWSTFESNDLIQLLKCKNVL